MNIPQDHQAMKTKDSFKHQTFERIWTSRFWWTSCSWQGVEASLPAFVVPAPGMPQLVLAVLAVLAPLEPPEVLVLLLLPGGPCTRSCKPVPGSATADESWDVLSCTSMWHELLQINEKAQEVNKYCKSWACKVSNGTPASRGPKTTYTHTHMRVCLCRRPVCLMV